MFNTINELFKILDNAGIKVIEHNPKERVFCLCKSDNFDEAKAENTLPKEWFKMVMLMLKKQKKSVVSIYNPHKANI